ncbi:MAG TPA: hypothetical protein ENJ44_04980, partial [Oceanospirillales bacterium]|nr:hypothetical protein [Oceanospirillales bacterium]
MEKDIPLTQLDLDLDNSRYSWNLESQREIIEWMTSGTKHIGEKIFALAKDITGYGLNPTEKVMVIPDKKNDKKYVVLEGNRRVTALKLLNNPDMAPLHWKAKYSQLVSSSDYQSPQKIPCVIINDEEVAFHFMEVKHLGELGGIGVVTWGAEEKARHQKRQNKTSREHKSLTLLDHVRESKLYDQKTKDNAGSGFPITTLERLLGDKDFRESIGLALDSDGGLIFRLDPKEVSKAVTKIINDFGSGSKTVRDVINKKEREKYRDEFSRKNTPNTKKELKKPESVDEITQSGKRSSSKGNKNTGRYQYTNPKERKKLVISGTSMPINPRKYNRPRRVYEELRKLPLQVEANTYQNAIALLIRTFLEMSIDAFIKENKIKHKNPAGWKDVSLTERAKAVITYFKDNNLLETQKIKV